MEESYLHREKQYLKLNAELENRFKEIKTNESCDTTKPRLNVFGIGPKELNQPNERPTNKNSNQKRSEIQANSTTKKVKSTLKVQIIKQNEQKDHYESSRLNIVPQKQTDTQQNNCIDKRSEKLVKPSKDSDDSTILKQNSNNSSPSSPNEKTVKKNISSEGLIKFLKTKVTILQQELELSQQENVKYVQAYEKSIDTCRKHSVQMEHVTTENENLKKQVDKLKESNNIYESLMKDKDADLTQLSKNIEELKKELKEVNRLHNSLEKRLLKSQDDLEHTKKNLNNSLECERQQRIVNNQQRNFFEDQIKALCKQRTGLISAYKKQLLLLDNLKRQNMCLEQSKLIQIAEQDFVKLLDWNN